MEPNEQDTPLYILLADDNGDDCLFFKEALEGFPLLTHLSCVHDGEELMQRLADDTKKLPDVLFLDLNMPRKNGFECLSEIKLNNRLKSLPVITKNLPLKMKRRESVRQSWALLTKSFSFKIGKKRKEQLNWVLLMSNLFSK